MTGAFTFPNTLMNKPRRDYSEQIHLLISRGMQVGDTPDAKEFLSKVSYYRLSGYFRYWQRDAFHGDNHFIDPCSLKQIRQLYQTEQTLMLLCKEVLQPIEIMLRTRFAYFYTELVAQKGEFATGTGFTAPRNPTSPPVEEYILRDLNRSKEAFVAHYRNSETAEQPYTAQNYSDMPIWVAVEALSFGTLSRLIAASKESGVLDALADSISTSRAYLPGQIRSFVYLRNRIAHCARIWNHSVLDVPGLPPNIRRRAQRNHRNFDDHSIYKIFVALDEIAKRANITSDWLSEKIDPLLEKNSLLAAGIATPRKYGEIPTKLLTDK